MSVKSFQILGCKALEKCPVLFLMLLNRKKLHDCIHKITLYINNIGLFLALPIIFGSTSEQGLNMPWPQHVLVLFCWVPSFLGACSRYILQRVCLQNSAKLCIHVDSTFYAFVSKVQCWLIKEKESGEKFQCKDSQ